MDKVFSISKKKNAKKGVVSINLMEQGFNYSYVIGDQATSLRIDGCDIVQNNTQDNLEQALFKLVQSNHLEGLPCNWVLSPNHYRVLLLDTPNVPEQEYGSAVKWQLKDLIDYPLEDAVVDVITPPKEVTSHYKKIQIVVVQKSFLERVSSAIRAARLIPSAIDIHEFAVRNLILAKNPTCFLSLYQDKSIFIFIKDEQVYLTRNITFGLNDLSGESQGGCIISELKKSLVYYQQQLKQGMPEKLLLSPLPSEFSANRLNFIQGISNGINIPVEFFDLNEAVEFPSNITEELQASCYVSIGGALRCKEGK